MKERQGLVVNVISEDVVNKTLKEVEGFSEYRAMEEMKRLARIQPDLLLFMMEFTQDLDEEVREWAIYIFFIVWRIFENGTNKKIKRIPLKKVIRSFEYMEKFLQRLEGTHERILERIAQIHISVQPYVMKYVLETLMETQEESLVLTDDDRGYIFILLSTIINVLNQSISG
jgi:hypothetical protein